MKYALPLLAVLAASAAAQTVAPAEPPKAPEAKWVEVVSRKIVDDSDTCYFIGYCYALEYTAQMEPVMRWGYHTDCMGTRKTKTEVTKYRTEAGKTYVKTRELYRGECR